MEIPPSFTARSIRGDSRGTGLGFPTVNLMLEDVPAGLAEGIYACRVETDGTAYLGALHHGPRPAFRAGPACEVYFLDVTLPSLPPSVRVFDLHWLREVRDFPTPAALGEQIAADVAETRRILG